MQYRSLYAILFTIFALLQREVYGSDEPPECNHINKNDINTFYRCCTLPEIALSEEKQVKSEECYRDIIADRPPPQTDAEAEEIYECFEECYFNASKWLTADLKLNETILLAEYNEELKSFPHWREPITKTVKICIKNDFSKPEAKCKSGAYQFSNCVSRYIFLNCPEDSWLGTDEKCDNTKAIFEKCTKKQINLIK